MINGIKNLIMQKNAYMEAASVILEDASGMSLDDAIVLGEETEEQPMEPVTEEGPDDGDNNNDDLENEPIEEPEPKPDLDNPDDGTNDDPMNEPIDSSGDFPAGDGIPTPIGRQTGEPVNDDIDDLLNAEIDLKSNTFSDILPVPPAGAVDAVVSDDFMDQRIDSGFGGEDPGTSTPAAEPDFMDAPIGEDEPGSSEPGAEPNPEPLGQDGGSEEPAPAAEEGDPMNEPTGGEEGGMDENVDLESLPDQLKEATETDESLDKFIERAKTGTHKKMCEVKDCKDKEKQDEFKENVTSLRDAVNGVISENTDISETANDKLTRLSNYLESTILLAEAISLDGDPAPEGDGQAADPTSGDPAPDDGIEVDTAGGENEVTAAVRDKVAEADAAAATDPAMDMGGGDPAPAGSSDEDLFKKITGLSKNLDDIKQALFNRRQ